MNDLKRLATGAAVLAVFWLWGHGHQPAGHPGPKPAARTAPAGARHAAHDVVPASR